MFDAGFWELLLISIIALVVVGPDKIPGLAKSVGKFVGKIKRFVSDTQQSVHNELGTSELKEQFGFEESESILEIIKDTEQQIKGQFDEPEIQPNSEPSPPTSTTNNP